MNRLKPSDPAALHLALFLSTLLVFAVDLKTPLGVAVWIFYVAPQTLTLLSWRPWIPLVTAAVQSVLMLAGYLLSTPGIDPALAQVNRTFGALTVWVMAIAAWLFIRGKLAVRLQEWLQAGQTLLMERMQGELTLGQLGDRVLTTLAEHLDAQSGAFFAAAGETGFERVASYALPAGGGALRFGAGEGLLGQAARDGRTLLVRDVPPAALPVQTAAGALEPRHLLIAPALADDSAQAVLELGFVRSEVDPAAEELVRRLSGAIALRVRSVKFRTELEMLLEETQRQAEELQAQGEELRVANEQLERQSRSLQDSQARLEEQQAELEQTNASLEEQTRALEAQNRDLGEAKRLLEAQARELEQASRYKSDFLASMSHELRTPLNSSLILARLLVENRGGNLTPEQVEYARNIEKSGNSLLELINDILDLAKVEAGRLEIRPQHVSLARAVASLSQVFEPLAGQKGLTLRFHLDPALPPTLETDPQRLDQILKNLLSNAVKFTSAGEVSLTVGPARGPQHGRISFEVRDTGIGIPRDRHQTVFEPFRQMETSLDRKYGGTGLGLSITRELVALLGGEIRLESEPGVGSVFTVVLPQVFTGASTAAPLGEAGTPFWQPLPSALAMAAGGDSSSSGSAASPPPPLPPPLAPAAKGRDECDTPDASGRSILIVEDDELFARILQDLAEEMGFRSLVASTAAEALPLAVQYQPSALVLDIGLPDSSGLALLDRLKADLRTRHLPVHMVSVHDYTRTALSLGAVGYVLKPVKREELVNAFQRLEDRIARKVRRILVVEDDADQRRAVEELLASPTVETVSAGTAAECLEQLAGASFDCMVLDLTLPDATGFEVLETVSREDRYSFPPVIVYTARDLTAEEEGRLRRYSRSIIIKGAKSPERLLDEVSLFLHQVIADLPPEKRRLLEHARQRDPVLEGRRVLLVEDDVRNVFALTSVLEPRGVRLEIARNGREALEWLERASAPGEPPVDLILMDVMMPEMDGLTATRTIRQRAAWRHLPVIALTAKAMKGDREQVLAAGANDYLAKPLDVDQLLSVMRVWMPR